MCKYFISSFNLVMVALYCVNLDAGEVFDILILAKWGIILLRRHLWLIYVLALQLYIIIFRFSYWWMNARLASLLDYTLLYYLIIRETHNGDTLP
jgi:hypothetical protein